MGINTKEAGAIVHCNWPVNGLSYGADYLVKAVRHEVMGPFLIIVNSHTGLQPEGGSAGYFPWRFTHTGHQA